MVEFNCSGLSNSTQLDYTLADTYTVVTGCIVFLLVLPFVLFQFRFLPIGTTAAVLVGAVFMVATRVISQDGFYVILGGYGNLRTIFLLLGMMIVARYFEREGIIQLLLCKFLESKLPFAHYMCRLIILTFIVAAFFTNDAACVLLTPLILRHWHSQNRLTAELETIVLAIATSANIGSVTTVFGNPQNALIASRTEEPRFLLSQFSLLRSVIYLGPPALLAIFINALCLMLHYKLRSANQTDEDDETIIMAKPSEDSPVLDAAENQNKSRGIFVILLWFILIIMIVIFFLHTENFPIDIGILPLSAAAMIMFLDALINKQEPTPIIAKVDWSVILMFFGIFIWLGGVNTTRVPRFLWKAIGLAGKRINDLKTTVVVTSFVMVGSNVFSNVPLVILVLEQLEPCVEQLQLVLLLSWCSTIAGNLTLFGSVANLIVAKKSAETLHYRLTFWAYLKYGFITTLCIIPLGVVIIYALLLI